MNNIVACMGSTFDLKVGLSSPAFNRLSRFKMIQRGVFLLCVLPLSGCGLLSGAGPYSSSIQHNATEEQIEIGDYKLIDISGQSIASYMVPPEQVASAGVTTAKNADFRVQPGDVIRVMISDSAKDGAVFAPLSGGGTTFESLRIDSTGQISLPYLGRIKIQDKSIFEIETLLRAKLKGIAADPQVYVALTDDVSNSVVVAGAVKSPGRFSSLQGPLTILDVINRAGGPLLEPHLMRIVVRNGSQVQTASYQEVLAGKKMDVLPRSEVIVEKASKRFVAMGAVTTPGLHDLPLANSSLLDALGTLGGLNEVKADPTGVFIFRFQTHEDGRAPTPTVFRLNMREPQSIFLARQFLVLPDDAIYVTNAPVYEWQKVITPIVQVLILGQRF